MENGSFINKTRDKKSIYFYFPPKRKMKNAPRFIGMRLILLCSYYKLSVIPLMLETGQPHR